MADTKYCQYCGASLAKRQAPDDPRLRDVCVSCGKTHYDQLLIGVGALIEQDGSLLLIRRSTQPFRGMWALPGGHVEADEDPQERVIAEVLEETSLEVEPDGVAGVYYHETHPRGPALFISYWVKLIRGVPQKSFEADECRFFARNHLPTELARGGHSLAIEAWLNKRTFAPRSLPPLCRSELWSQLSNVVQLRSSQDQVLWTIFGAFWAANSILLVALFQTGKFPDPWVGIVVAAVGAALSLFWIFIQRRALHHLVRHESIMQAIESELRNPPQLAISAGSANSQIAATRHWEPPARRLMPIFSVLAFFLWLIAGALFWFARSP